MSHWTTWRDHPPGPEPGKLAKNSLPTLRKVRLIIFDFDGVFTSNTVYVSEEGKEMVRCSRSDGLALRSLAGIGLEAIVLSSEANPVVRRRCGKLSIECVDGCEDKAGTILQIADRFKLQLNQIAFVGNDSNDAECLRQAGFPIVVNDAFDDIIPLAVYRTQAPGGAGAVREVCQLFCWAHGLADAEMIRVAAD